MLQAMLNTISYWGESIEIIEMVQQDIIDNTFKKHYPITSDEQMLYDLIYGTCVYLFGNYGTSPFSGWITEKLECDIFLDNLCLYINKESDWTTQQTAFNKIKEYKVNE